MMEQPSRDLFGNTQAREYPDAPGHRGVETSVEAAESVAPGCGRLQKLTLEAITGRGTHGATADEAADACGMDRWSIQPRVSELRKKGLIADSGQRRRNATGKRAIVWVLPKYVASAGNA